jgi:hypothetical protein
MTFFFNIEKSTQLSSTEREELLSQVDFSRVNEETIAACKTNKLIPQQLITDAALALCVKLRKELEETRNRLHSIENGLNKTRPNNTTTTTTTSSSSKVFIDIFIYLNNLFLFRISSTSF